MARTSWALQALLASSLALAAGCDGGPSVDTTTAEATVKGVVKLDGKPATEGEIIFDGGNSRRSVPPGTGKIGKDGTYEVKTVAGQNTVTIGGSLARKYGILQHKRKIFAAVAGENTYDFEASTR